MLAFVERHPIPSAIASATGLSAGAANAFHMIGGIAGDIAAIFGAIITTATIIGMIRTWLRNRKTASLPG